jgi:hypothetical protein
MKKNARIDWHEEIVGPSTIMVPSVTTWHTHQRQGSIDWLGFVRFIVGMVCMDFHYGTFIPDFTGDTRFSWHKIKLSTVSSAVSRLILFAGAEQSIHVD